MNKCWGCYFYGRTTFSCDYLLLTGTRRGCPANACTRYTPRGKLRKQQLIVLKGSRRGRPVDDQRIQARKALYDLGLDDHQIAEKMGVTPAAIWQWRRREGLPANASPGGRHHD